MVADFITVSNYPYWAWCYMTHTALGETREAISPLGNKCNPVGCGSQGKLTRV